MYHKLENPWIQLRNQELAMCSLAASEWRAIERIGRGGAEPCGRLKVNQDEPKPIHHPRIQERNNSRTQGNRLWTPKEEHAAFEGEGLESAFLFLNLHKSTDSSWRTLFLPVFFKLHKSTELSWSTLPMAKHKTQNYQPLHLPAEGKSTPHAQMTRNPQPSTPIIGRSCPPPETRMYKTTTTATKHHKGIMKDRFFFFESFINQQN